MKVLSVRSVTMENSGNSPSSSEINSHPQAESDVDNGESIWTTSEDNENSNQLPVAPEISKMRNVSI